MDAQISVRKVAIEALATLVHLKDGMVRFLLEPAGVPADVYRPLFQERNAITGRPLSKRQIAPLLLAAAVEQRAGPADVARRIVEIAAAWERFDLAEDQWKARAVVQEAKAVLGLLVQTEAKGAQDREQVRLVEVERQKREREEWQERERSLLLSMFDDMARGNDPQRRGYLLQDFLNRVFSLYDIAVHKSFTRNDGAEQIDGGFRLEGTFFIVECRWRKKLADIRELDGLSGQVRRGGKQAMGLFLSINGWSDNVPGLLKQNPDKSILLMNGYCLRSVLERQFDLRDFVTEKLAELNYRGEPYLSVQEYVKRHA